MAFGLQTFDGNGAPLLRIDSRLLILRSIHVINNAVVTQEYSTEPPPTFGYYEIYHPGMVNDGNWFMDCPGVSCKTKIFNGFGRIWFYAIRFGQSTMVVNVWSW